MSIIEQVKEKVSEAVSKVTHTSIAERLAAGAIHAIERFSGHSTEGETPHKGAHSGTPRKPARDPSVFKVKRGQKH